MHQMDQNGHNGMTEQAVMSWSRVLIRWTLESGPPSISHHYPHHPLLPPIAFAAPTEVENTRFRAFKKKKRYGVMDGPKDRPSY